LIKVTNGKIEVEWWKKNYIIMRMIFKY
jgi:hypothetical protein